MSRPSDTQVHPWRVRTRCREGGGFGRLFRRASGMPIVAVAAGTAGRCNPRPAARATGARVIDGTMAPMGFANSLGRGPGRSGVNPPLTTMSSSAMKEAAGPASNAPTLAHALRPWSEQPWSNLRFGESELAYWCIPLLLMSSTAAGRGDFWRREMLSARRYAAANALRPEQSPEECSL